MPHHFIKSNGIVLHYLEKNSKLKSTIILMHGLIANANSFESYMDLIDNYHVISVDLRGRGLSDKPNEGYSIKEHALDIIGLLDALNIDKVILAGHSFGGLLAIYLAANYPKRILKTILIDVAAKMNPKVGEMVMPTSSRLKKKWKNYKDYISNMKKAPFLQGKWSGKIESFYKAECMPIDNGIEPRSNLKHIQQAVEAVLNPNIHWEELITQIKQPSIVINASEPFIGDQMIVSEQNARETVNMMHNCEYAQVKGNHVTMLFDEGAIQTVAVITKFIK